MVFKFNGQIPKYLFWLIKLLGISIGNPWDPKWASDISDYIESDFFNLAKKEIALMEKYYGVSTETVRLATRISTYEILGKKKKEKK